MMVLGVFWAPHLLTFSNSFSLITEKKVFWLPKIHAINVYVTEFYDNTNKALSPFGELAEESMDHGFNILWSKCTRLCKKISASSNYLN